jgi:hypothetical protein
MVGVLEMAKATADLILIAFYYLLRVGEYTHKAANNNSKQTVEFRAEDVTFFKRFQGKLRQLPREAPDEDIMSADSSTLKIDNQKNGLHGVCINHEHNGDEIFSPVRGLGRRYLHLRHHGGPNYQSLPLSMVFQDGKRRNVTDKEIRAALKSAAAQLDYPSRGIPIERVDTHSLRCGGANALSLAGYSDRHIQKLGRWRGETFKVLLFKGHVEEHEEDVQFCERRGRGKLRRDRRRGGNGIQCQCIGRSCVRNAGG